MPRVQGAGRRRPGPSPPMAAAGLLAVALLAYGGMRALEDGPTDGRKYRPLAGVPRLETADAFVAAGVFRVADFEWIEDRLYVLDGRSGVLLALERMEAGWTERFRIDARGGGPGELHGPMSVAAGENGTLLVLEANRLQRFAADGSPLGARPLELPCLAPRGMLATLGDAIYVAGTCIDGAPGSDTVAALLWAAEPGGLRELARAPRFTRDAKWGNAFTTERVLGAGRDRLLFGSGLDACLWTVVRGEADARVRCGVATERFVAGAPAALRALDAVPKQARGRAWVWQPALPWYHDVAASPAADLLFRLWSADSLVLRPAASQAGEERDLLVTPFHGLIGCRAGGCLWKVGDELAGARLVGLDVGALEHLVASVARP